MDIDLERIEKFRKKSSRALIGNHKLYLVALDDSALATPTNDPVIIFGETGTGKEWLARAIHGNGPRADKPFIAVDCALFTPEMLHSQLFGHARGAFTGAHTDRKGYFRTATEGTILLDEIQELPRKLQAALLRVIETGEFYPLGSDELATSNARIIATAKHDLEAKIQQGDFSLDLFNRFPFQIYVPALRERAQDIRALAQHILKQSKEGLNFSEAALDFLGRRQWYGNIRELVNTVTLTVRKLPPDQNIIHPRDIQVGKILLEQKRVADSSDPINTIVTMMTNDPNLTLKTLDDLLIVAMLKHCDNKMETAAEYLGVSERTIKNHLKTIYRKT